MLACCSLLASSCGAWPEYQTDRERALCTLYERCGLLSQVGAESREECVELMDDEDAECEGFNSEAAELCLEGLSSISCSNWLKGLHPRACDEVCELRSE